jgi:hypothetical protein
MSPAFARRFRCHLLWIAIKSGLMLSCLGLFAAATLYAYFQEGGPVYIVAFFLAAFLYFAVALIIGIRDSFRVRVLPYFERRLGKGTSFMMGKSLLEHSHSLDEIAKQLGAAPLSEFATGDDMVCFEKPNWHEPTEALRTTQRLLNSEAAKAFPEDLRSDLKALEDALAEACRQNVRFGLLLREGSSASGLEMDRRKGSFF